MTSKEDLPLNVTPARVNTYPTGKNYLFIIAIDDYRNGIEPLCNAVKDANVVADCLIEKFQFDEANCQMLINENATQKSILKAFDEYIENLTIEDNLILYFSGHGTYRIEIQTGYWMTAESVSQQRDTFLSNNEVFSFIRNIKARHVFAMVDSCYQEGLFSIRGYKPPIVDQGYGIPSRWLLTAGRLEPVSDGIPGDHSPFAKALIAQLKHLGEQQIWGSRLCQSVLNGVSHNVDKQKPRGEPLQNAGHQGGDFLFVRKGYSPLHLGSKNQIEITSDDRQVKNDGNTRPRDSDDLAQIGKRDVKEIRTFLVESLSDGNWRIVFSQLRQIELSENKRIILLQIIGRYNMINEQEMTNSYPTEYLKITTNKIRSDLLRFISDLQEKDLR